MHFMENIVFIAVFSLLCCFSTRRVQIFYQEFVYWVNIFSVLDICVRWVLAFIFWPRINSMYVSEKDLLAV